MPALITPLTYDITLLPLAEAVAAGKEMPPDGSRKPLSTAQKKQLFTFPGSSGSAFPSHTPFSNPTTPTSAFTFNPPPLPEQKTLDWNWFGAFNTEDLSSRAEGWLYRNGVRGQIRAALVHFLQNCQRHHFRFEHQAVCLSLRIERQQDIFNTPNPHHDGDDGKYWDAKPGDPEMFKLGTVLLGPGTVFYDTDDPSAHWALTEGRKEKAAQGESDQKIREWLDEGFKAVEKRSVRPGEIARWSVGNDCKGTIHSEPNMNNMPDGRVL